MRRIPLPLACHAGAKTIDTPTLLLGDDRELVEPFPRKLEVLLTKPPL